MSEETVIRPADPGDAEKLVEFNVAMAFESEGLRLKPGDVERGVKSSLDDPARGRYYVAERGGRILGQIRVTREWSDWNNSEYWWIQNVYVAPPARRQGIYAALHRHVVDLADEAGACGLQLYVDKGNQDAQAAYRRLGMNASHYLIYEQNSRPNPGGRER